jgi:hypothetical protein
MQRHGQGSGTTMALVAADRGWIAASLTCEALVQRQKGSLKLRASVARLKKICRSFKLEVLHAQLMAGVFFNKMASVIGVSLATRLISAISAPDLPMARYWINGDS